MKKKLLAISGSPHENGSTAAMLHCAMKTAASQGWEITMISLYKKQISYCKGCRSCIKTGQCVLNDDIREIAELMKTSDRIILSAPVYWANVPGIVKNLFDRLLGTAMEETTTFPRPRLSGKQDYLLLTACNTPFPFSRLCGQSSGALRAMNEFFKTSGMTRLGTVTFSGAKGKAELPLKITRKIGRLLK